MSVKKQGLGSTAVANNPIEIKHVRAGQSSSSASLRYDKAEGAESQGLDIEKSEADIAQTPEERRAKRKEEFREANDIRNRAIAMEKRAKEQMTQTSELKALLDQAKDDPTVLAKALNMDQAEFQRKIFNKTFSIADEPKKEKEETFEEQTKRRLAEYEEERAAERKRQADSSQKEYEQKIQNIKYTYVKDNIMPLITEEYECILDNGKEACAEQVYDLMNAAYQDEIKQAEAVGRTFNPADFTLQAIDVIKELEEKLEEFTVSQISRLKEKKKFKSHFRDEERREEAQEYAPIVRRSATLSHSSLSSAPPSVSSPFGESSSPARKIPLKNREARREQVKRVLGSEK
jgi:hypothetical protein